MRILMTSTPGMGHVHPMVPLAEAFRRRGDDVAWSVSGAAVPSLTRQGFEVYGEATAGDWHVKEYWRRYPEARDLPPSELPTHMFPRLFGAVCAPVSLPAVRAAVERWKPDVLVCDAAEFAGHIVAAGLGIPSVTHAFGAISPRHRVEAAAVEVAPLWEAEGLAPAPFGGAYAHLYLDIYPPSIQNPDAAHVVKRQLVRPVAHDGREDDEPLPALAQDAGPPLVYLTFGTVFNAGDAFRAAVAGLAGLDVRLVVTVGPGGDVGAFGALPPHVQVEQYVPQSRLLPRCDLVASHAGSGTFLVALAAGRPQLCLPQAADQFHNASACAAVGAGITLSPDEVTPESVREAAALLLGDESYRTRAARMGEEIEAMPSPDEAAAVVVALV